MKKKTAVFLIVLFVLLVIVCVCGKVCSCGKNDERVAYTPEEIYDIAKNSAVEIITYDKNGNEFALGSGFVWSPDGKIITNYHVIEYACSATATISDCSYPITSVLFYDTNIDIAVLKINAVGFRPLDICHEECSVGESVYAIGSPKGLTNTFSPGIVTASCREIDGVLYVQHNAPISSGNSGGMLLNSRCEIVGINTSSVRDSQNLNFAISVKELDNIVFNEPMTLLEVYKKECDAFEKVKKYAVREGSFDSENGRYTKVIGTTYTDDGTMFARAITYTPSSDLIELTGLFGSDLLFVMELDEDYYSYKWYMCDYRGYYMKGVLYANTFSKDTTYLSYSYTNIPYSNAISSFKKLAASFAQLLIMNIDSDLKEINVTAYDLDFLNF